MPLPPSSHDKMKIPETPLRGGRRRRERVGALQRESRQVTNWERHQEGIDSHDGRGTDDRKRREHVVWDGGAGKRPLNTLQPRLDARTRPRTCVLTGAALLTLAVDDSLGIMRPADIEVSHSMNNAWSVKWSAPREGRGARREAEVTASCIEATARSGVRSFFF